jgi:hypothetical protein
MWIVFWSIFRTNMCTTPKFVNMKSTYHTLLALSLLLNILTGCKSKENRNNNAAEPLTKEETPSTPAPPVTDNKTVNDVNQPNAEDKKKESIQENTIKNLVVSFYSIGSGIDYKSAEKFEQFLSTFTLDNGSKPVYEKIGWGREGEIDYCITLDGWNYNDAASFVEAAKGNAGASKNMHFTVNGICKKRR